MNPSRTSIWVAAARAQGAREPEAALRNPDGLAEKLLGPEELAILGESALATMWDQPYDAVLKDAEAGGAIRMMMVRTRFIDSRLEAAIREGATQVVILGAGFDSRAYRFKEMLHDVRVFEVDQPGTQQLKMRRVREALGDPPSNLTYVPVDFRRDKLGDELAKAGYKTDQQTFFNWEGVTMYLPAEAVKETLRWVASNSAPGSTIIFDYTYESVINAIRALAHVDIEKLPEAQKQMTIRYKRLTANEPWLFGLPNRGEKEFLAGLGLELRKVLGVNDAEAVSTYLTRGDGSILGGIPASEQQWYLILQAVVQ